MSCPLLITKFYNFFIFKSTGFQYYKEQDVKMLTTATSNTRSALNGMEIFHWS